MTTSENKNEVFIAGGLEIDGKNLGTLSGKTNSRAVSSFDRLIGNILNIPADWLENHKQKQNVKASTERALMQAEGDAALMKLQNDAGFGQRVANGFIAEQTRKQYNKEAIVAETINILSESTEDTSANTDERLNPDWLNMFDRYAQDASTEDIQKLWAHILSGEIKKPKSFSKQALRIISEIDQDTARLFQKISYLQFDEGFIIKPKQFNGNTLINYTVLEEAGLLQDVNSLIHFPFQVNQDGYIQIKVNNLFLSCKLTKQKLQINVIKITKAGREISKIFPTGSDLDVCKALSEYVYDDSTEIVVASFPLDADGAGKLITRLK